MHYFMKNPNGETDKWVDISHIKNFYRDICRHHDISRLEIKYLNIKYLIIRYLLDGTKLG